MNQGIFGIVDFNRRIDGQEGFVRAVDKSFQTGKIESQKISYYRNDRCLLGMKRTCNEPSYQQNEIAQIKELGAVSLISGEVHNYHSLKKDALPGDSNCRGDLDLSIHLYRALGPDFAKKLNGLFSLAIFDQKEPSFIILNDRFGMAHQIYWTITGSRLYFASHLKSLMCFSGIGKKIDSESVNLFLKYSYIPSPWTILKGIRKLSPGHLLTFRNRKVKVTPYWEFCLADRNGTSLQESVRIYKELLTKSISNRVATDGQTGILLSGGLDSSANVALARECTSKEIKTFSVGFEDPAFDERPYARIVAKHFNTQHFETAITGEEIDDLPKLIWHLEEPYFEFGLFLTYIGLKTAREEVDIVLGGEGADQLFGTGGFAKGRPAAVRYLMLKSHLLSLSQALSNLMGGNYFYKNDNWAFKFRLFWNRATDLNNWYFYGYDQRELLHLYQDPALAHIPIIFPDNSQGLDFEPLAPTASRLPASFADLFLQTQINQDLKHYVNENVMVKSGRMADMLGLTLRESYLDTEVTDFLTSLDFPMKRAGGLSDHLKGNIKTKYLHRKAMEGLLPPEILQKPKQGGFVPVMIFLKNPDTRKRIYRHLLASEVLNNYFRIDYLKNLFEGYEQMQGRNIYWHNFYNSKANQILFLLTFDIWHHLYMKNNSMEITPPSLREYLN